LKSKFLNLANLKLHYLNNSNYKNKINILMIHGLSSSSFLWEPLIDQLGKNYNYYALDLRGHGLSDKPSQGYELSQLQKDVNLFIEKLGLKKIIIVGQSMGAEVSVLSSIKNKNIIGCVAVDGGIINLRNKFKSKDECLEALKPPDLNGIKKEKILKLLKDNHPDWSEKAILGQFSIFDVDKDNKVIKRLELKNHLKLLESLWSNNSIKNLKSLSIPILFILVSFDINFDDFEHDKIDITLKKLTGDHDIHAQKPEIVSKIINSWIEGKFIESQKI